MEKQTECLCFRCVEAVFTTLLCLYLCVNNVNSRTAGSGTLSDTHTHTHTHTSLPLLLLHAHILLCMFDQLRMMRLIVARPGGNAALLTCRVHVTCSRYISPHQLLTHCQCGWRGKSPRLQLSSGDRRTLRAREINLRCCWCCIHEANSVCVCV